MLDFYILTGIFLRYFEKLILQQGSFSLSDFFLFYPSIRVNVFNLITECLILVVHYRTKNICLQMIIYKLRYKEQRNFNKGTVRKGREDLNV